MKYFCFVTLLFFSFFQKKSWAQQCDGVVLDAGTNIPIAYVNVGIVNKNYGTVSDNLGKFSLDIPDRFDADTLRFSMIGYETINFIVKDFRKSIKEGHITVRLSSRATFLQEVTVKSSNQPVVFGNQPGSRFVNAGLIYNNPGHEIGSMFKTNQSVVIDSVKLNIAKCAYDSIFLRLNIYSVDDGQMENILSRPIYLNLDRKSAKDSPVINLSVYDLQVNNDFFISVELVKQLGERGLSFYASMDSELYPALYRETSQGEWKYIFHKTKTAGISILTYAH